MRCEEEVRSWEEKGGREESRGRREWKFGEGELRWEGEKGRRVGREGEGRIGREKGEEKENERRCETSER